MNDFLTSVYEGATPGLEQWIDALGSDFPLLRELVNTPHDAEWHAEGNVHIHTSMVLDEAYSHLQRDAAYLDIDKRFALVLGAVFHDIGKPLTTHTRERAGRMCIVSPHHPERGREWLADRLPKHIPHSIAQQVLAMVGHHHDWPRLLDSRTSADEYWRFAQLVDTELLYHLEIADVRGRISHSKESELKLVEEFGLRCREYGVWGDCFVGK